MKQGDVLNGYRIITLSDECRRWYEPMGLR